MLAKQSPKPMLFLLSQERGSSLKSFILTITSVLFLGLSTAVADLNPFVTIEGKVLKKTAESLFIEIESKKVRIPWRYLDEKKEEEFTVGDEVSIELERKYHDEIVELNKKK